MGGEPEDSKDKDLVAATSYVSVGMNMAVGVGVFSFIGYKLDEKYGGTIFTIIGVLLGCVYIGYESWKLIKKNY